MNAYSYPNAPASGKTDTSAFAASSIEDVHGRYRRLVYSTIERAGSLTSEEIADRTGVSYATCQPRTTELRLPGSVDIIAAGGQRSYGR